MRTAADTIVRLDGAGPEVDGTYGLACTGFADEDTGLLVVGYGAHPREHETYCFFACEGYPAFVHRYIILRPVPGAAAAAASYEVIFLLRHRKGPAGIGFRRFEGHTGPPRRLLFDRREWQLDDVEVVLRDDPAVAARLSGKVVAKRNPRWVVNQYEDLRRQGCAE